MQIFSLVIKPLRLESHSQKNKFLMLLKILFRISLLALMGLLPKFTLQTRILLENNSFQPLCSSLFYTNFQTFFKHTLLMFIPKSKNAFNLDDFHPISLCTTFYKTIAKLLVNRLKKVLSHHIHPTQTAFI